jgi:cytochrome c oxidase subunit II
MWNFPVIPDQASAAARQVDAVFLFDLAVAGFFTVLIFVLVVGFAVYYRQGSRADRSHPPAASRVMEVIWVGVPLVLGLVMFAWGAILFFRLYEPPGDALDVSVVAKQWMWYVQHAEGRSEINELHVPLGRAVKLTMTSQDVIHSFYVPAFRVKQDVLPGRYTSLWFQPAQVGRYHLYCAEYCGTYHSQMGGWVEVQEAADYQRWLSQGGVGPSMAEEGERLFVQHHCAGCHQGSQTVRAPRLEGVFGRPVPIQQGNDVRFVMADATYVRDSILRPKAQVVAGYEPVMPSYEGQISEPDLLKIMAYIKSLAREEAAP